MLNDSDCYIIKILLCAGSDGKINKRFYERRLFAGFVYCIAVVAIGSYGAVMAGEPVSRNVAKQIASETVIHSDASAAAAVAVAAMRAFAVAPANQGIRGLIIPRQQATISAAMAATITFIGPDNGEAFKKGDTLVAFDCRIYQAELNRAQAVASAAGDTARVKRKLAASGSISKLQAILARSELRKARADVAVAKARAAFCILPAPFSGRVVRRIANAYETMAPRDPLLEIVDDSNVEIRVFVPSVWLRKLRVGTRFSFHVDETGALLKASVIALGASIDNVSQLVELRAKVLTRGASLLPGMSGDAQFNIVKGNAQVTAPLGNKNDHWSTTLKITAKN